MTKSLRGVQLSFVARNHCRALASACLERLRAAGAGAQQESSSIPERARAPPPPPPAAAASPPAAAQASRAGRDDRRFLPPSTTTSSSSSSSRGFHSTCACRTTAVAAAEPDAASELDHHAAAAASSDLPLPAADSTDMLLDRHGRRHTYLRISLTEKCNLRCRYCMPAEGVRLSEAGSLLSTDEVVRLAGLFVGAGVTKIRLTGGEPTVARELEEVCERLGRLRAHGLRTLAITTNGLILERKLAAMKAAGLNMINVSLDTLVPAKFEFLTRRRGHARVLQAVEAALRLGFAPVKLNCVVMRGFNDDEVLDFVELTRDRPINVRFIEFMPFDGNVWDSKKLVSYAELLSIVKERHPSLHRLLDHPSDTAKNFRVAGYQGSVSFITSMTNHFCGGCNRLRLMADGNFKVCLFGPAEVSLRDAIRSGCDDAQLQQVIAAAVQRKKAAHAGMFEIARTQNRPMIHIGG